ncbi:MAG: ABC transporter ATP-binding protein [Chloroflexota bacterium]
MSAAVEAVGLTKRFRPSTPMRDLLRGRPRPPERVAVDDVDLRIERGEVFGLLGQNGAGKTTLVRMLTTLLVPSGGTAHIEGLDVVGEARRVRARIGLINGDERSFYWRLTGRHNLEFFAALRHLDRRRATSAIDRLAARLGMTDHLDRPFGRLSTGQRQALAIIRGLLDEPSVLFMDEPTRSLDPISAERLRRFIADVVVGELGRTVVLATHSMVEAEELCGRLGFLQDGRLVALGSVEELRRAIGYGTRCELRLGATVGDPVDLLRPVARHGRVDVAPAGTPSPDGAAWVVQLTLPAADALPTVLDRLVGGGVPVLACRTSEMSLEEIYLQTLAAPPVPVVQPRPVTAP